MKRCAKCGTFCPDSNINCYKCKELLAPTRAAAAPPPPPQVSQQQPAAPRFPAPQPGYPQQQPLGGQQPPQPPPFFPGTAGPQVGSVICRQCGMQINGPTMVCTTCGTSLPGGIGRRGNLLIIGKFANLPNRCVKCNGAADAPPLTKNMQWYPPWTYLLLLLGVLPFILIALVMGKKASVTLPLCTVHRKQRSTAIAIGWLGSMGGLFLLFLAASMESGFLALLGFIAFFGAIIYGIVKAPLVTPALINDTHVHLKGVHRDYLANLPEVANF